MAIQQAMCTSFKAEILDEGHDLVADTLKVQYILHLVIHSCLTSALTSICLNNLIHWSAFS